MKLVRLAIRRMPGIEEGFTLERVGPGLNLIVGPNGIGKSSAMTALRLLLWPDRDGPLGIELSATFTDGDVTLLATQRAPGQSTWQRDGAPVERPALPEDRFSACFFPKLHDLLVPGDTDEALGKEIARQLAGGYDVPALLVDGVWGPMGRPGQAQSATHNDAKKRVDLLRREQGELSRAEQQLGEKRQALGLAKLAEHRLPSLARAAQRLEALQARDEAAARLATFPAGLEALRGDEPDQLAKLAVVEREAARQVEAARLAAEDHEQARRATGLEEPVAAAQLGTARAEAEAARADETALEDLRRRLAAARVRWDEARRRVGGDGAVPSLLGESSERVEGLLKEADQLRQERARVDAELAAVGGAAAVDDRGPREAASALREWLAAPELAPVNSRLRAVALLLAVLGVAAGVALAVIVSPVWAALAVVAAVLGVVALLPDRSAADPRPSTQTRYLATGQAAPAAWERKAVEARLSGIDQEIQALDEARVRAGRRAGLLAISAALQRREQLHAAALSALRSELGVDAGGALGLAGLWEALRQATGSEREVLGLDAERAAVDGRCAERLARVGALLARFGYDVGTAKAALAGVDDLGRRDAVRARHAGMYEQARRDEQREANTARSSRADAEAVLLRAGATDVHALRSRLAHLDGWKRAVSELDAARGAVATHERGLAGNPELLTLDGDALRAAIETAKVDASSAEVLAEQITATETKVGAARSGRTLEDALAARAAALEALRASRETALRRAAGRLLLERVNTRHEAESRPAVLQRAMELFATFTHHAFTIVVDREGEFRAKETRTGEGRSLSELSDGTRGQLLLAVRLAFAAQAERPGVHLPFVLDEALSISDPSRFDAVVESLTALVATEDRQVFYLTSQPVDALRWRRGAGAQADSLVIHDLGAIRGQAAAAPVESLLLPAEELVPAPGDDDAEAYAFRLHVPRFRPLEGAAAQHPWQLLDDDLPMLHTILGLHIDTVGGLTSLLGSRAGTMFGAEVRSTLAERARWLGAFCEAYAEGRGRPVGRAELTAGGISNTFIEAAAALAESLGGDAGRVLASMRSGGLKGLRVTSMATLEEWLRENDRLDPRPMLLEGQLLLRVLEAVSDPAGDAETVARRVAGWWARCDAPR